MMNETTTAPVPMNPETVFETDFPKKTLNKNPKKGVTNKSKIKLFSILGYPFKFFNFDISIDPMFRYTETKIANPTATSAAATAIEKKTKICPSVSWWYDEKATNNKFTAFNMISIDMKTMIEFLLYKTPKIPMQNKSTDRNK